ncbi:hypothetical protein J6590_016148 [Homalodisca vitripennis]|nr:hypothetical protein J6590_016148 [Homalodisca vitripennis]
MEWSNQKTTLFIEDYHNTPELWDNRSAFYKDRNIKCDKLNQLAIKYDCSVTDLKKNVKYLRSAFHREHKRITKPKSGSSPKKEKWFAYNLLTFLLDVDIPRETFSEAETLSLAYRNELSLSDIAMLPYFGNAIDVSTAISLKLGKLSAAFWRWQHKYCQAKRAGIAPFLQVSVAMMATFYYLNYYTMRAHRTMKYH